MKHRSKHKEPVFIPYDDENMEHVLSGPDYGQPWSSSAWIETDSKEYTDFVELIANKILKTRNRIL